MAARTQWPGPLSGAYRTSHAIFQAGGLAYEVRRGGWRWLIALRALAFGRRRPGGATDFAADAAPRRGDAGVTRFGQDSVEVASVAQLSSERLADHPVGRPPPERLSSALPTCRGRRFGAGSPRNPPHVSWVGTMTGRRGTAGSLLRPESLAAMLSSVKPADGDGHAASPLEARRWRTEAGVTGSALVWRQREL